MSSVIKKPIFGCHLCKGNAIVELSCSLSSCRICLRQTFMIREFLQLLHFCLFYKQSVYTSVDCGLITKSFFLKKKKKTTRSGAAHQRTKFKDEASITEVRQLRGTLGFAEFLYFGNFNLQFRYCGIFRICGMRFLSVSFD